MHDFRQTGQECLRPGGLQSALEQHCPDLLRLARLASTVAPILYLAGLWNWVYFFAGADLHSNDWRLTLGFQSVLRDALARAEIPYLATFIHYTNQFLGLPEIPLSPQYLLLPFFDDWTFNVLNICLLYTVCHAGLLLIRREFGLSPLPFVLLYLLFNFNGYLVSRLGVGHSMWLGYFFLPFVHLFLLRLLVAPDSRRPAILLVLTLVLIELQGSFHIYVWCLMYLGIIALFNPRFIKALFFVCAWSFLLCTFRFLPAAVTWWGRGLDFLTGFSSPVMLLNGLTAITA